MVPVGTSTGTLTSSPMWISESASSSPAMNASKGDSSETSVDS